MKVLAIETSTISGGVAVIDGGRILAESSLNVSTTHSEGLMPSLELTLKRSGVALEGLDALAVSVGPGSFTGLRVGLGTVKGLAYATGTPVAAVPTLEAFAWSFPHCALPVCTMLDARKNEVYAAVFMWEGDGFRRLYKERPVSIRELAGVLNEICAGGPGGPGGPGGRVLLAGEGAELYRDELEGALGEGAAFAPPHLMAPSAANVAFLGHEMAQAGEFTGAESLSPQYIRKSEAELKAGGGGGGA